MVEPNADRLIPTIIIIDISLHCQQQSSDRSNEVVTIASPIHTVMFHAIFGHMTSVFLTSVVVTFRSEFWWIFARLVYLFCPFRSFSVPFLSLSRT